MQILFEFMIALLIVSSGTVEKPADKLLMLIWIVCMLNKEISTNDPDGKYFMVVSGWMFQRAKL